jgi:hypothetical protein
MNSLDSQESAERDAADESQVVALNARKLYRFVSDGLGSLGGLDVAAGVCGTNAGDLRRSLDRDGRRLCVDHAMAIGMRLCRYNATLATQIASAFVFPFGLEVFPRVTLTPEERARRLERMLRSMPLGEQLVEEALKTP